MGGHKIHYDEASGEWKYLDNNETVNPKKERPCVKCGELPTEDDHDACIANLGSVINACCGHGKEAGYVQFDNGITIRGYFKIEKDVECDKLYTGYLAYDFLGNTIAEGDHVVCLVYSRTSADLRKGVITKMNPKTVMVKLDSRQERRFDYSKIVRI